MTKAKEMSDAQIARDLAYPQESNYEWRLSRHGLHYFHMEFYEECPTCQAALTCEVMETIDPGAAGALAILLGDRLPPSKWRRIKRGEK